MDKLFSFISSLTKLFFDQFGNPEIKFFNDCFEVYFTTSKVFHSLDYFDLNGYDELRFFAQGDSLVFVFIIYRNTFDV